MEAIIIQKRHARAWVAEAVISSNISISSKRFKIGWLLSDVSVEKIARVLICLLIC